jgi:signal transduction histidine kinase
MMANFFICRKICGKFSLISVQMLSLICISLAISIICLRYYEQESVVLKTYTSELHGVSSSITLMHELIAAQSTTQVNQIIRSLESNYEESDLILDSHFDTYFLANSFFLWFPKIFGTNDQSLQSFYFSEFSNTFKKSTKVSSFRNEKLMANFHLALDSPDFLEAAHKLVNRGFEELTFQIQDRIDNTKRHAAWSLILAIVLWTSAIVLTIFSWRCLRRGDSNLNHVFNEQLQTIEKHHKLAVLGEISASIGHDIANPLSVIEGSAFLIERDLNLSSPELIRHLREIRRMVGQIAGIIANIKSFSKKNEAHLSNLVDLNLVFEDLQLLLKRRLLETQTELSWDFGEINLLVMGCESAYVQIFANLINNSIDAMAASQQKKITISAAERGKILSVKVQDSGPGISPEISECIFESFFTTKKIQGNTGLGLSICKNLVQAFGGELQNSPSATGACFEMKLPIAQ